MDGADQVHRGAELLVAGGAQVNFAAGHRRWRSRPELDVVVVERQAQARGPLRVGQHQADALVVGQLRAQVDVADGALLDVVEVLPR